MIGGSYLGLSIRLPGEFSDLVQRSRFDTLEEEIVSNNVTLLTNPPVFLRYIL
jgi:hypothetical protein